MNKIDWKEIQNELKSLFCKVEFELDGHKITIQNERTSETKSVFALYIDGYIKGKWNEKNFPIVSKVWFSRSSYVYNKKNREKFYRKFGKKFCQENGIDEKISYLIPYFSSSRTLISQFKKIEGLRFVNLGVN